MNKNINKLLAALKNVKDCGSGQWTSYCPIHESGPGNHNNSLSIKCADDGRILVYCHNGCDPKDVIYATGLSWKDCFPPKREESKSKITAVYDYEDYLDGERVLRFQVCRLEPDKSGAPGTKDFRQRQPDGKGGFTWKTKGVSKIPYRLPELIESRRENRPVFIVEGEKQVDYLRSLGLVSTCNPGGAGKWLKSFAKYLDGRDVIVVPDCDPPNPKTGLIVGADHAKEVADSLIGFAKSIHVVELPGCEPKWGLDDWLQKGGHTLQELSDILSCADEWGPESSIKTKAPREEEQGSTDPLDYDRKILSDIGITYVAQCESSKEVEVFSSTTQKFSKVEPASIRYEDLILITGSVVRTKVRRGPDDDGLYSMNDVKGAIASIASVTQAVEEKRGAGCWLNNGSIVVVGSKKLGIINGDRKLQVSSEPLYLGTAYDIGCHNDWVDLERLSKDLESVNCMPGKLYCDDIWKCVEFISQWNFVSGGGSAPMILAGMIMSTYLQTLWAWRPQIFLIGQSSAGKTLLLKRIAEIMGPLASVSSDSSSAGLRQEIRSSASIIMCDELEKSRHRTEILEMIRASGRGDNVLRGTTSQKGKKFKIQHIFWCASIESGLKSEADQSRFITFEIGKTIRNFEIPNIEQLRELGRNLFSASIASFHKANDLIPLLTENRVADTHSRVCESYAVPCAMLAASLGWGREESIEFYRSALSSISEGDSVEDDADVLLQEILLASVVVRAGEKQQVYRMIERRLFDQFSDALESVGISVSGDDVHLNRRLIERYLVSQSWQGKRLDQILMRLPGARRGQIRIGNSTVRTVVIPLSLTKRFEASENCSATVADDF